MATGGKEPSTQHCVKEEPAITLASVYLAGDLGAGGQEGAGEQTKVEDVLAPESDQSRSSMDVSASMTPRYVPLDGAEGEEQSADRKKLCIFLVLDILLCDALSLLQVIVVTIAWKLTLSSSSSTFDWDAILINIKINLIGEFVVTDLLLLFIIAYRCSRPVRHGLYAMDIFPMWKRTLNWQRMLLFSTFPLMTMPVFFSLLSTSHVVKEEDGSTFLRIVT